MNIKYTRADKSACTGICGAGIDRYRAALHEGEIVGKVPPCLLHLGLLRKLEDAGAPNSGAPCVRYMPVPPAVAAANLARPVEEAIEAQRSRLAELRSSLAPLEAVFQHEQRQREIHVQHLIGEENIGGTIRLAVESCTEETLTAQPKGGSRTAAPPGFLPFDLTIGRQQVSHRSLYSHTVRAHGPALAAARRSAHHGCQVRTAGTPFEPLIVCDRAFAFIPVPAPRGLHPRVLAIREPGLVEYFVRTFDALWERAEPLTVSGRLPRAAPKTDEVEQAVLELMVKGHTDAAISTRLGVSVRTIGTYIKRASERFDSHSRAELGYRLAKSGLFEAE